MTDEELYEIECKACPSGGSCSGMFTANSMNVLCEAMGIALPGNGTVLALTPEREALLRRAARRTVEIATRPEFKHAQHPERATPSRTPSWSTWPWAARPTPSSTCWPSPARPGVPLDLEGHRGGGARVAHVAKIAPSLSTVHIEDVHRAGGVSAVLKEIARRGDVVRTGA